MNDFAQKLKHQRYLDTLFVGTTKLCSAWVLAVLLGMVVALAVGAMPAIKHFGFHFFSSSDWDTNTEIFGALSPIFGSLFSSAIALLIAVPTSFGIAVFLTELCPRALRQPLGICIELLAGIPSIIYGMWGLFIFAPFFSTHIQPLLIEKLSPLPFIGALFKGAPMGIGIFTASVILAIMIIPYIASVMRDVFSVTPPHAQRISLWLRGNHLGSRTLCRAALYQNRRYWRHHFGLRASIRRNHGRDICNRQYIQYQQQPI